MGHRLVETWLNYSWRHNNSGLIPWIKIFKNFDKILPRFNGRGNETGWWTVEGEKFPKKLVFHWYFNHILVFVDKSAKPWKSQLSLHLIVEISANFGDKIGDFCKKNRRPLRAGPVNSIKRKSENFFGGWPGQRGQTEKLNFGFGCRCWDSNSSQKKHAQSWAYHLATLPH